jgi:hypothetical protein
MQVIQQTLLPLAGNGNKKTRPPKPLKIRFHKSGEISVRVDGIWHHDQQLLPALYLSAPAAVRRRVVQNEFITGRPLVSGSPVLIRRMAEDKERINRSKCSAAARCFTSRRTLHEHRKEMITQ